MTDIVAFPAVNELIAEDVDISAVIRWVRLVYWVSLVRANPVFEQIVRFRGLTGRPACNRLSNESGSAVEHGATRQLVWIL